VIVRKGKPEELPALKELFKEVITSMSLAIWDDYYPSELLDGDIERGELYVAYEKEVLLGAFTLVKEEESSGILWSEGEALYLERFAINPSFWRKGYAVLLLEEVKKLASPYALRLLVVDRNLPAIKLYEKVGFEKCEGEYLLQIDDKLQFVEYGYEFFSL